MVSDPARWPARRSAGGDAALWVACALLFLALAALVFGGLLVLVAAAYYWSNISRTVLFWAAFVLTRPLGAAVGDFLDKPLNAGGLAMSRYSASAALFGFIVLGILIFRQRAAKATH